MPLISVSYNANKAFRTRFVSKLALKDTYII